MKKCAEFWFAPQRIPNMQKPLHRPAIAVRDRNKVGRSVVFNPVA